MSERNNDFQNFLSSAQGALAEFVAKNAADQVANSIFEKNQNQQQDNHQSIYPELPEEDSFLKTAQTAFTDELTKKSTEKIIDGIFPQEQKQNNQSETDLIGTLLQSLSRGDQTRSPHQNRDGEYQSGIDLSSLGATFLQLLNNGHNQDNSQNRTDGNSNPSNHSSLSEFGESLMQSLRGERSLNPPQNNSAHSEHGFNLSNLGAILVQSLGQTQTQNRETGKSSDPAYPGIDLSALGKTLLQCLSEHTKNAPQNKVESSSVPQESEGINLSALGASLIQSLSGEQSAPHNRMRESVNDSSHSGIDLNALGATLLQSLDRKDHRNVSQNKSEDISRSTHSEFDLSGLGTTLLNSLSGRHDHQTSNQYQNEGNMPPHKRDTTKEPQRNHGNEEERGSHEESNAVEDFGSFLVNSLATQFLQPHHK